jgi:hypothetical protein
MRAATYCACSRTSPLGRLISPSCPQTVRRPRPRTPIANGRPPILALASQAVPHHYATRGWLCRGDIFVRRPTRYRTQRGSEGKGEFCGFEYPATGQDYLPYMTKWVRSDQFVTLFVKAAHQPYLPDRVPWVVVLFALGQCKLYTGSIEEMIPLVEQAIWLRQSPPRGIAGSNSCFLRPRVRNRGRLSEPDSPLRERARVGPEGNRWFESGFLQRRV